ncbi:hypothetical protein CLOLEP_00658 [[Clostridium] leptum DSM 753]|uniref:Uncharacterized protein n=1 Tax=[Clostridium] leptum DSM 753 TaxID=428125 RepID=A7VQ31_9FIRM|nr:hypothetical protein CLOLEP_00658 [[Clostridium] leptum DSM 753]
MRHFFKKSISMKRIRFLCSRFLNRPIKTADFNGVPVLAASRLYQSFFDKRTLPAKSRR